MSTESEYINLDVLDMISGINKIYSSSYKKFFHINPERYINVDDLITDLSYLIPKWDSHASLLSKNTLQDTTQSIINSYGNGYIFVSRNCKIDNINSICKTMVDGGVKNITINLLQLGDSARYEEIICGIILPFIDRPQRIESSTASKKLYFDYEPNTRRYSFYQPEKKKYKEGIIYKTFKDININIMFNQRVVSRWVQRLSNSSNVTIYCYEYTDKYYSLYIVKIVESETSIFNEPDSFIGIKHGLLISDYPRQLTIKVNPLPKKLRPMTLHRQHA